MRYARTVFRSTLCTLFSMGLVASSACAVEQFVIEIQADVEEDLLAGFAVNNPLLAVVHIADTGSLGAVGYVCAEGEHPSREPGLYERSFDIGPSIISAPDKGVNRVEGLWHTKSFATYPDCEVEEISVTIELRAASGADSCDALGEIEDLYTLREGALLAETQLSTTSAEHGSCAQTATRVGPSSTNMFAREITAGEPILVVVATDDAANP